MPTRRKNNTCSKWQVPSANLLWLSLEFCVLTVCMNAASMEKYKWFWPLNIIFTVTYTTAKMLWVKLGQQCVVHCSAEHICVLLWWKTLNILRNQSSVWFFSMMQRMVQPKCLEPATSQKIWVTSTAAATESTQNTTEQTTTKPVTEGTAVEVTTTEATTQESTTHVVSTESAVSCHAEFTHTEESSFLVDIAATVDWDHEIAACQQEGENANLAEINSISVNILNSFLKQQIIFCSAKLIRQGTKVNRGIYIALLLFLFSRTGCNVSSDGVWRCHDCLGWSWWCGLPWPNVVCDAWTGCSCWTVGGCWTQPCEWELRATWTTKNHIPCCLSTQTFRNIPFLLGAILFSLCVAFRRFSASKSCSFCPLHFTLCISLHCKKTQRNAEHHSKTQNSVFSVDKRIRPWTFFYWFFLAASSYSILSSRLKENQRTDCRGHISKENSTQRI